MAIWPGLAGSVLVIVGRMLALLQRGLVLQSASRALSAGERSLLARVFHDSVAYDRVRVVEGRSGLFGLGNPRPFALANTIYLKLVDPVAHPAVLVHECAHVWQYQHRGSAYAYDALVAQRHHGYDWRRELAAGRTRWIEFNPEAQAQLLEDLWRLGTRAGAAGVRAGSGAFFEADGAAAMGRFLVDGVDHTALAHDAVSSLRIA